MNKDVRKPKEPTSFEELCRQNRAREDIKRLNETLKRDKADGVQNLNNSVAVLTGKVT